MNWLQLNKIIELSYMKYGTIDLDLITVYLEFKDWLYVKENKKKEF